MFDLFLCMLDIFSCRLLTFSRFFFSKILFRNANRVLNGLGPDQELCSVGPDPGNTRPRSAVRNVSGCRYVSDCRPRNREFDPDPVPYFRGD